ncbi:MAG: molybdenum cofactor biosynthesis protein MoaB [Candidatus Thermoplasmatota archaeon]|jgi:molybdenum cofactor biosynthesis protein B|nr:molybdenum cofactor biosynthesis protein MoaB [Candidatus Thermoplasmatota archaeon]
MSASHHHPSPARSIGFALLTTTDQRTEKEDESGRTVRGLLEAAGHRIVRAGLSPNSPAEIRRFLEEALADPAIEAIITLGGTGVSPRDRTVDTLEAMGGKKMDGFGERFRQLSFEQVGTFAMMSRSALYLLNGRPVFALPGSVKAGRLATEELILPLVPHLVEELRRS